MVSIVQSAAPHPVKPTPEIKTPSLAFSAGDFFFGKWKTQIRHDHISMQLRLKVQRTETADGYRFPLMLSLKVGFG
jgi:hypothetical protein